MHASMHFALRGQRPPAHPPVRAPISARRSSSLAFVSPEQTGAAFGRVQDACRDTGRDPASLVYSAAQAMCCGRTGAELARRAAAAGRGLSEMQANGLAGSPAQIVDKLGRFAAAGVSRVYLQILDLHDLDHLELIASEIMPQVR